MSVYPPVCQFCGKSAGLLADPDDPMCLDCIKARARVATGDGQCHCSRFLRRESEVHTNFSRKWTTCKRCLGVVKHLS